MHASGSSPYSFAHEPELTTPSVTLLASAGDDAERMQKSIKDFGRIVGRYATANSGAPPAS